MRILQKRKKFILVKLSEISNSRVIPTKCYLLVRLSTIYHLFYSLLIGRLDKQLQEATGYDQLLPCLYNLLCPPHVSRLFPDKYGFQVRHRTCKSFFN